ncbi:unnamed protein product [Prunus armeniaca]|uniref:Exostosin GT47 domain-containing protein n=1 Tax=Prunus armeniaca TaxID=36596 RepID=A0A6J5W9C3_PRUAR|nr:unnamed protein product [Prunus armeniaca]
MGQDLLSICQAETKRLLWIAGMLFAVILVVRHLELPYGNLLSSILSSTKVPLVGKSGFHAGYSPSNSEIVGNLSLSNDLNNTGTYAIHEKASNTRSSDSVLEGNEGSNRALEIDEDEDDGKDGNLVKQNRTIIVENVKPLETDFAQEGGREPEVSSVEKKNTTDNTYLESRIGNENNTVDDVNSTAGLPVSSPAPPMMNSSPSTAPAIFETNVGAPIKSVDSNVTSLEKDQTTPSEKTENSEQLHSDLNQTEHNSSMTRVPVVKIEPEVPILDVYSISDMNNLLLQSRASYHSVIPQWSSPVDQELQYVASQIENAPIIKSDPTLYAPLYRNLSMFKRSYELMEDTLKVYVYREGERPILHSPFLKGIYASEGWFMKQLEANKKFVTKNPQKAHLYYLPFSSRTLEERLYVPNSHSHKNLIQYLKDYVDMIAVKHPFWNRTGGADHFLVACHDWAPSETKKYMATCIRALCNSDIKEGFVFGKDVSLPETYIKNDKNPLRDLGGNRPSKRSILAFFAGSMHGYVRPILWQHWEDKDPDMKIFSKLPKAKGNKNYVRYMQSSKYCICAKGYEVNSPRVVEAIFYECVPVIISDNFVPPFFEVLNWESFAVFVLEKDIPNLKNILLSIPKKKYLQMQMRVKKVQKHFLWHAKPENAVKVKSGNLDGSSKGKIGYSVTKKKIESSSSKQVADVKQKSVQSVTKTEVKPKPTSVSTKSTTKTTTTKTTTTTRVKEKKVYTLAGQKFDPPEEREPLRIFYESLSKQIPTSEMAEFWMMEHGLLSPERSRKAFEKKQRKQKQLRLGTPIKSTKPPSKPESTKPPSKPESSQRQQQQASKNGDVKGKKRVIKESDDDDDFILSPKRRRA